MPNSIEAKNYVIKGVSYPEPEAIDLGLPSGNKWANMNIGASSVNEIGGYYGWADPTGELTVDSYYWRNTDKDGAWLSPLFGGTNPPRDISGTDLDIATNKLGADWCMPSSDDFKELTDNCSFMVEGEFVRVTGPNGNLIVLPLSGMWNWGGYINNPQYEHSMEWASCFWASTRSFYNHGDSDYWAQYNQPAADYAHADADGFWGADGTCDSWYRNGMIPIRAIKRGKNDAGYVEVCGIKWAKGNLLYDAVDGGDQTFETNWKLAPEQWYYFNYADGFGQQTYDQWENQIDHFNFGVCGSNALSNSSNPTFNRLYDVAGKMYTDANCTQECSDFSKAQYGDIAFWASRGKYRMPTMAEFHKIGDEASISFGYCLSQDNKKVYGCLFTNPVGERIIDSNDKQFTKGDLDKGLFLPFNSTRLNPEATAGHNGKLIYYGNDGSYWSSEVVFDAMVAGTNERVNMPCGFIVQNFAGTDMDDGVHTLMTYFIGGRHQGQPIRPVLVNQNGEIVSNNNTLSCLDVQCLVGTTPTLNVVLQNDDEVKLCQFDLQLPTGVTVATKSNGKLNATLTTRAENHSISSQQLSNGNYRFIVSSMDNDSFTGNNGTLMEITLNVPTTMEAGEYTVKVLNAELSVPNGNDLNAIKLEETESKLIVKDFTPGDVNNDGSVSVTDVGCAINYILEQVPSVFVFEAADMNGDKTVSVTDVGMIINLILNEGASGSQEIVDENVNNGYQFLPNLSLQLTAEGYGLHLNDKDTFIGFQFDVELCDGATLNGMQLNRAADSDHLMTYRRLDNGKWRVVCYSPTNSTFAADDTVLLTISTTGNIIVSDIRLTTLGLDELHPAALVSMVTGIANLEQGMKMGVQGKTLCITSDRDTTLRLLTIGGSVCRILHIHRGQNNFDGLRAGIYMINKQKIIIR